MILPAGRGCSVTCGWCGGGRLSHKKFQGRTNWFQMSPGRTAALIARSVEMGFSGVQACFDPVPSDPAHWISVAEKVGESNVRTHMYFESYAVPHPDLVDALVKNFDSVLISMSPESPDEVVRKRFRPLHFSNDDLVNAVAMCASTGANVMLCFGQGLPGETLETPKKASRLVHRCKKAARGIRLQCRSFAIEMEPGSPWAMKPRPMALTLSVEPSKTISTRMLPEPIPAWAIESKMPRLSSQRSLGKKPVNKCVHCLHHPGWVT